MVKADLFCASTIPSVCPFLQHGAVSKSSADNTRADRAGPIAAGAPSVINRIPRLFTPSKPPGAENSPHQRRHTAIVEDSPFQLSYQQAVQAGSLGDRLPHASPCTQPLPLAPVITSRVPSAEASQWMLGSPTLLSPVALRATDAQGVGPCKRVVAPSFASASPTGLLDLRSYTAATQNSEMCGLYTQPCSGSPVVLSTPDRNFLREKSRHLKFD